MTFFLALQILTSMRESGVQPDVIAYTTAIKVHNLSNYSSSLYWLEEYAWIRCPFKKTGLLSIVFNFSTADLCKTEEAKACI